MSTTRRHSHKLTTIGLVIQIQYTRLNTPGQRIECIDAPRRWLLLLCSSMVGKGFDRIWKGSRRPDVGVFVTVGVPFGLGFSEVGGSGNLA